MRREAVAEIVALRFFRIVAASTGNVALLAPPATVTLGGTVANDAFDEARATTRPPAGAGAVSAMLPVARVPPTTFDGCTASVASVAAAAGCTVSEALRLTPAKVAVRLAVVVDATALVVIGKVAEVAPVPTPIEAGTSTDG